MNIHKEALSYNHLYEGVFYRRTVSGDKIYNIYVLCFITWLFIWVWQKPSHMYLLG